MPSFGQPDPRTAAQRLEDLRHIQRQVTSIRTTRDDSAFAERFIAGLRERRAGRTDRTQFELIPDKHGGSTLAAYNLDEEPVAELDDRVVRLRGRRRDLIELAHLATSLRRQGVPISANYLTPMGGYVKGVASPEPTAGAAPGWPLAGYPEESKPGQSEPSVRVIIIDTGVYGDRGDRW